MSFDLTLLIDAGNSRVKFGWMYRGEGLRSPQTLALGHSELNRLPEWLAQLPGSPSLALGVSVTHASVVSTVEASLLHQAGIKVRWLRSSAQAAGVANLYDQPDQLGNDRWIALVGLSRHTHETAVLASFGTATTVDTLGPATAGKSNETEHGSTRPFQGGLILPGPELMRQSLTKGTAGLPYANGDAVAFPRNTHSAIQSGIAAAQAGAVLRQWQLARKYFGLPPKLFCSGGGWPLVAEEVSSELAAAQSALGMPLAAPEWLDAPVLDGLAVMAAQG